MSIIFPSFPTLFLYAALITLVTSCDNCIGVKCPNGGECEKGECLCSDGVLRQTCVLDTCFSKQGCKHGNCEYGFCNCDENWIGTSCDSLIYKDHHGDYFGAFICNNYQEMARIQVRRTEQQWQFKIHEPKYDYSYLADFKDAKRFTVAKQVSQTNFGPVYIEGYGKIDNGILYLNTVYSNDSLATDCSFEGEFQPPI